MLTARQTERLLDAVAAFHAAPDYDTLSETCSAAVVALVPCDATILLHPHQNLAGRVEITSPIARELNRVASQLYTFREDGPVYLSRLRNVLDSATTTHRMISEEAFSRTTLFNEALRPIGIYRRLEALHFGVSGVTISAIRGRGAGDFSDVDVWVVNQLARHFSSAVDRMLKENDSHVMIRGARTSVDRFSWLVCDDDGFIVRSTPESARVLKLCLGLNATPVRIPPAWREELRRRQRGHPAEVFRYVRAGVRMSVHPVPIRSSPGENSVGFILYPPVADPLQPMLEMGLSRREAEVMRWAAEGRSNAEIAELLGISALTAKKHMENVLHKLGVQTRTAAAVRVLERVR